MGTNLISILQECRSWQWKQTNNHLGGHTVETTWLFFLGANKTLHIVEFRTEICTEGEWDVSTRVKCTALELCSLKQLNNPEHNGTAERKRMCSHSTSFKYPPPPRTVTGKYPRSAGRKKHLLTFQNCLISFTFSLEMIPALKKKGGGANCFFTYNLWTGT